ncbi:hypothetical protein [Modestobacter sp. VKM Ac-2985]|uniref:hypothetical protein n=1 Tax=Modestobacter sp. VKM Ac-2985 TaxID=3004139 RepID=UPI0022AB599E|nr:hypothetical protein [Modestobacter sp. VKM Ac-2985]MCZ2837160.1 hypothetical protein [Modestobacter sp. VKM Ac-2985]
MTGLQIALTVLVVLAASIAIWGTYADRRDYLEIRADLDELAGDFHSPADRAARQESDLGQLDRRLVDVEHELTGDQPSSGRHAHTDEQPTGPIALGATRAAINPSKEQQP